MDTISMDVDGSYELQKSRPKRDHNTKRQYPQRDKNAKTNTYSVKMYANQSQFDRYYSIYFNKNNRLISRNIYIPYDQFHTLLGDIKYLKNFVHDVCNDKITGFQTNHLDKTFNLKEYENGNDMTYQELADFLNCKVVVNGNLKCDFSVPVGHTDDAKYCDSGFGRIDMKDYSQRGYSHSVQKEDPNNLSYYLPKNVDPSYGINEYILMITPPIRKKNYQYSTQMKPIFSRNDICGCCWLNNGRMWMLKGMGYKSIKKNKGMKRQTSYELKYLSESE